MASSRSMRTIAAFASLITVVLADGVTLEPVDNVYANSVGPVTSRRDLIVRTIHAVKRGVTLAAGNGGQEPPKDEEPHFLIGLLFKWGSILATYKWPSWVIIITALTWFAATFLSAFIGYAVSGVMTTAIMAQSDKPHKFFGLGSMSRSNDSAGLLDDDDENKLQENDVSPGDLPSKAAMVVVSTHIRNFFREAKQATGTSLFRTGLRGARWGCVYSFALAILLNIGDGMTTAPPPSSVAPPQGTNAHFSVSTKQTTGDDVNEGLPFTLPGTTFGSVIFTFIAFLLASPLHTMCTFAILRLSPSPVSSWRTLKSLPLRTLFVPAAIAAVANTLLRMILFSSVQSFFTRVAAAAVDVAANGLSRSKVGTEVLRKDDNPVAGIFWAAVGLFYVCVLADLVLTIPTQMILIRTEAAMLVSTSMTERVSLPLSPSEIEANGPGSFTGLRTLVSVDTISTTSTPGSRSGLLSSITSLLSLATIRDVALLSLKKLHIQMAIFFVTIAFIVSVFAMAYNLNM